MAKEIKWIAFQPLMGCMDIGAENAFGTPPVCIIDYKNMADANSSDYVYYMNEVRKLGIRRLVLDTNHLEMDCRFNDEDAKWFEENCKDVDAVVGVPICSGLSSASTISSADNERNDNMMSMLCFTLEHIKPRAYIFENAPRLYTSMGKYMQDKLTSVAEANGYSTLFIKTNTLLHWNVQNRPRTFAVFFKGPSVPAFHTVSRIFTGTVLDYLKMISPDALYNSDEWCIHTPEKFAASPYIRYMKARFGENYRKVFEKYGIKKSVTDIIEENDDWDFAEQFFTEPLIKRLFLHNRDVAKSGRGIFYHKNPVYCRDNRVPTIFAKYINDNFLIHPIEDRGYTIREFMTFMGFPNDYVMREPKKYLSRYGGRLGQNVPALTSQDWCEQIKQFLNGELRSTGKKVAYLDNTVQVDERRRKLF